MVYAITDNGKNLTPAEKYGSLRVILSPHEQEDLDSAIIKILSTLSAWRPSLDSLIMIGHPLLIAVAYHQILCTYGYIELLVWDRESYSYQKIAINQPHPSQMPCLQIPSPASK